MHTHIIRPALSIAFLSFLFVVQIGEAHAYQTPGDVFGVPDNEGAVVESSDGTEDAILIPSLSSEEDVAEDIPDVVPEYRERQPVVPATSVYSTNNRQLMPPQEVVPNNSITPTVQQREDVAPVRVQVHEAARSLPSSGMTTFVLVLIAIASTIMLFSRKKLFVLFS